MHHQGLELVLRLPRADATVPTFVTAAVAPLPLPAAQSNRGLTVAWAVVTVVAVIVLYAAKVAQGADETFAVYTVVS